MSIQWSRLLLGILGSVLIGLLGLAAVVGLVIAFSSAETIAHVQALTRFGFITSVTIGLGCVWGAFVSLRRVSSGHVLHGFLIGLAVGLINFLITPAPFMGNLLTLLMTMPAGILGGRLAELNPRPLPKTDD